MSSALLLWQKALAHYELGELADARQAVEDALHAALPHEHETFADCLLLLANLCAAEGNFTMAERFAATCGCYIGEHLNPQHSGIAVVKLNRAVFLLEDLRLRSVVIVPVVEKAQALLLGAERLLVNVCDSGRLVLAEVLHNKGVCCALLGQYVAALTAYMRSMQIRVRFKDAAKVTDLKLALTMEQVALLYRLMEGQKRNEAALLMEVVASTRRELLGPRHPLLATAVLAQGLLAAELGHRSRAQLLLREALEMSSSAYGEDSPHSRCAEQLLAEVS